MCSSAGVVFGSSLSATVYVDAPNSTVTSGSSSSVIEIVVTAVVPAPTLAGSAPNASFTLSSSSSTVSEVAVNVNVFDVSPVAKLTDAGTPE